MRCQDCSHTDACVAVLLVLVYGFSNSLTLAALDVLGRVDDLVATK